MNHGVLAFMCKSFKTDFTLYTQWFPHYSEREWRESGEPVPLVGRDCALDFQGTNGAYSQLNMYMFNCK